MTKKQEKAAERFRALSRVWSLIQEARPEAPEGKEELSQREAGIVVMVTGVARSGLSRTMRVFIVRRQGLCPVEISALLGAARVAGSTYVNDIVGMRVSGAGMDMPWYVIDCLRVALLDEGLATNVWCDFTHWTV